MKKVLKFSILLVILILLMVIIYSMYDSVQYPVLYTDTVKKYSIKYDLDPYLILGVIKTESDFNEKAQSKKDARGLMQIMPETGEWIANKLNIKKFDSQSLYNVDTNINFGSWYISYLDKEFNSDEKLILAAYNGGIGNVKKWQQNTQYSKDGVSLYKIPFEETRLYVDKVLGYKEEYLKKYPDIFLETELTEEDNLVMILNTIKYKLKELF